jgi:membrane protein implicated in regulation of membrane protease activity
LSTQWWVVVAVVLVVVVVFAYVRSRRHQVSQTRELRMSAQEQGRAQSSAEDISQREDRRLGAMTPEDRAWETASLERNREREERASRARASSGID